MDLALPDARSILMLRATHENNDSLKSSIVWSHEQTTSLRHLRDIAITEHREAVRRLLAVADSRFQPRLVPQAQTHGKLPASYVLPERYSQHLLAALDAKLLPIGGLRQSFHPGDDGKHTF